MKNSEEKLVHNIRVKKKKTYILYTVLRVNNYDQKMEEVDISKQLLVKKHLWY